MDTHEILTSVQPPQRARKKHIVLFVIACVFLLIALSGAWDLIDGFLLPDAPLSDAPAPPSDSGTGTGWFGLFLGEALRGFALFVLLAGSVPYWCAGLTLSVILASHRRNKPAWLWGVSLGLAVAFGLTAAGVIAVWILA